MNGYWTNFIASGEYKTIQQCKQLNESEEFAFAYFCEPRHELELVMHDIVRPILKPGNSVASVPCGLMSEVLMAADHFEGVKFYAIDIDKANFDLIREKYGDRLIGNDFLPLEMDALKLEFESTFDLLTCLGFMMYIKKECIPDFFSRIFRSLKLGGRVLISYFPDVSEQSPLFPFDFRSNPIGREVFMCANLRSTTRLATSTLVRHLSQAGFVRITIHGGTYYLLPVVEAVKGETHVRVK